MNRWGNVLLSIFTVLVVGGIAVAAYSIGFDNGVAADANIEVVRADGVTDLVGPRWENRGWWFPFGFIFPLFFLFFIFFLVSRAFWWRPWRYGGHGPGGPGPQGWSAEKHLEDWHRHAHANHPPSDPTGTGA
jgi:hypothetical protein